MNQGKASSVLWTGGKDCSLAFYEAEKLGFEIAGLITFAPPEPRFIAHPIDFMKIQAEAMDIPHEIITISGDIRKGYVQAFSHLKAERGISVVITGDITEVDGFPGWVGECCSEAGIDVIMPLWGLSRKEILDRIVFSGFRVIISCGRKSKLHKDWVGREIDENFSLELCKFAEQTGIDPCGEQGEFHTLVLDAPVFKRRIHLKNFSRLENDQFTYLKIKDMELVDKFPG
jgi:diphthine-ammonia ligase